MTPKLNYSFCQLISDKKRKFIKIEEFKCFYKICGLIGKGSYGCVYSAIRLSDELSVAVKHIDKHRVIDWRYFKPKNGCKTVVKIPIEIYLMDKLKTIPGIIQLIEWFETDYSFLIVMEKRQNSIDLFELKKRKLNYIFSEFEVKTIFRQLLETLNNCLKEGVIYRDVKPENIIINVETLAIKLIDFGGGGYPTDNISDHYRGTLQYCPPEYLIHKTYFGELQMVWSLGVLLFELVYGDIPFENEEQIVNNKTSLKIPENTSTDYKNIIQKCLSRNPLRRPSVKELISNPLFI